MSPALEGTCTVSQNVPSGLTVPVTTKLSVPCQKPSVIMYRSFKNFVDDYFLCDLYHLLESLNSDTNDAINTYFKNCVDCLDDIVNFQTPLMCPIWIVNGGKFCIKGIWCVIIKINIIAQKIMNGTETNVSISEKCQKSRTSLSDAKVVQKK